MAREIFEAFGRTYKAEAVVNYGDNIKVTLVSTDEIGKASADEEFSIKPQDGKVELRYFTRVMGHFQRPGEAVDCIIEDLYSRYGSVATMNIAKCIAMATADSLKG